MQENFETELDRLAALQMIDGAIKERQDRATVLRGEAAEIDTELSGCRDTAERLGTEHSDLDRERLDLEDRVKAQEEKIKGSRMRMARIRNEREQQATQHEINQAKETVKQIEDQLLAVMEKLEEVDAELASTRAALEGIEGRSVGEAKGRQEELDRLEAEIAEQQVRRAAIVDGMDEALRAKYEQIFSRRGGMAVVEVRNGTCQGCHMNVPPQLFNDLQKFREVYQCPNCQRILFWRPNSENG